MSLFLQGAHDHWLASEQPKPATTFTSRFPTRQVCRGLQKIYSAQHPPLTAVNALYPNHPISITPSPLSISITPSRPFVSSFTFSQLDLASPDVASRFHAVTPPPHHATSPSSNDGSPLHATAATRHHPSSLFRRTIMAAPLHSASTPDIHFSYSDSWQEQRTITNVDPMMLLIKQSLC